MKAPTGSSRTHVPPRPASRATGGSTATPGTTAAITGRGRGRTTGGSAPPAIGPAPTTPPTSPRASRSVCAWMVPSLIKSARAAPVGGCANA
eukprot:842448-Heterocapsa_arctica.AAC.1